MAYLPILGNAGEIRFSLYKNNLTFVSLLIAICNYEESYIECDGNEIVYDENDNAMKTFVGFKKQIKFSVFNSAHLNNKINMLNLLGLILQTKTDPSTYRIESAYRDSSAFGTIRSSVFVELPIISDVSKSSNIAEEFKFVIEEKEPVTELLFGQVTGSGYLLLESGAYLLLESGCKIHLEQDKYL